MMDFQKKKKIRSVLYSPLVVGLVGLVALYAVYSTFSVYEKMAKSRDDMEASQKSLLALDQKNQQIDNEISDLQTSQGLEKEIREKFGVAKPDERVAVIVPDGAGGAATTSAPQSSMWNRIRQFFGL